MTLRALLLLVLALSGVVHAQDMADGAVTGVIRDVSHGGLPGVQVTVVSDDTKRQAITDQTGHFAIAGLVAGRYQVTARLNGFAPTTGTVTVTPDIRRTIVEWSLAIGCNPEDIRIIFNSREAAPIVDTIAHVRVQAATGRVRRSSRPECEGEVVDSYRVEVLSAIKSGRATGISIGEFYVDKPYPLLAAGGEYLVLLWRGSVVGDRLALPIINGRVIAPKDPLDGRSVADAWTELSRWSRQRP